MDDDFPAEKLDEDDAVPSFKAGSSSSGDKRLTIRDVLDHTARNIFLRAQVGLHVGDASGSVKLHFGARAA